MVKRKKIASFERNSKKYAGMWGKQGLVSCAGRNRVLCNAVKTQTVNYSEFKLKIVNSIGSTKDKTPSITFHTTRGGALTFTSQNGLTLNGAPNKVGVGKFTLTFSEIANLGTYSGESITVTSNLNGRTISRTLIIPEFIIQPLEWLQMGQDIDGDGVFDNNGRSVSLSSDGNTVAMGAIFNDDNGSDSGHVRIFDWNGTNWQQRGLDIDGENTDNESGESVSLSSDGNTVAIGADTAEVGGLAKVGQVRVFDWNGASWQKRGQTIVGQAQQDQFGGSVSLSSDGNTLAIGADLSNDNGNDSGHVYIYYWNQPGLNWLQKGLKIIGEAAFDKSGYQLNLSSDGNTVAIGAYGNNGNGADSGHVRIYDWDGASWQKIGLDIDGENAGDFSGISVSLSSDGNTVAIGAPLNDGNGTDSGHVRIYDWDGASWQKRGLDIDGEDANDRSGRSVSLSSDGNIVAIGAPLNNGNGSNSGHVRIFRWS